MIQFYFPKSVSPARLDKLLASGWFRDSTMLYRAKMIFIESDLFSIVNIRLKLAEHTFKKNHRKLLSKNAKRFRVEIGKLEWITAEKNKLYYEHKAKFKGFIHRNLQQYLMADSGINLFDTYEVCVYDQDRLVALSFFDFGKNSVASLLGLYSADYEQFSLGTYTMLLEIQFAIHSEKKYYYPGYVLDRASDFDYKLKLGDFYFYDWKRTWKKIKLFKAEEMLVFEYKECLKKITQLLDYKQIKYSQQTYTMFGSGYLTKKPPLLKGVVHLLLFDISDEETYFFVLEYFDESKEYVLALATLHSKYESFLSMEISSEYLEEPNTVFDLWRYKKIILSSESVAEMVEKITEIHEYLSKNGYKKTMTKSF